MFKFTKMKLLVDLQNILFACAFILLNQTNVICQTNSRDFIHSTVMNIKNAYSNLENYAANAIVSTYNSKMELILEATFEIQKSIQKPLVLCWQSYLSNYPLAFTNACLIMETPHSRMATYCIIMANRSLRKEDGPLDLLIAKYSGVAGATIPIVKLILGDSISSNDRLSNFISGDISLDTLIETLPSYRLELSHTFTQQRIVNFELTEEILGEGSYILTLWVDPITYIIQQYSISLTSAQGHKSLTNVVFFQSASGEYNTKCENCCC